MGISIIIPCYNSEKYIDRCILSIINQTYTNWEAILIDDGSTDNTVEIIKKYASEDSRIHLIKQENLGQSVARNVALCKCNFEYVTFIDSDDYIDVKMLEIMINESNNCDLVICNYYESLLNKINKVNNFNKNMDDKFKIIERILLSTGGVVWGKLFKLNIIRENSILFDKNIRISEDQIFNVEYLEKVNTFKIVDNNLYYYNIENNQSLSKKRGIEILNNQLEINRLLNNKLKWIDEYKISSLLSRRLYIHIYKYFYEEALNKEADFKKYIEIEEKIIKEIRNVKLNNILEKIFFKLLLIKKYSVICNIIKLKRIILKIREKIYWIK